MTVDTVDRLAQPGTGPMDRPFAVTSATIFGIVAVLVFIIQPGYVQGLVDLGRLSGAQAGYIASAEMTGYAATMILMTLLSHRVPWRPMIIGYVLVQALGNALSMVDGEVSWLAGARFVAGLGAGGLSSLSFTAIGMTRDPDRNFGYLIMWILIYGAVGLYALPSLFSAVGLHGFYAIIIILTLASLVLVGRIPMRGDGHLEAAKEAISISLAGRAVAVASIFIFFLGCGILWAYVSLIGNARGLAPQSVANALSLSQFTGVAGAAVASFLTARFGRANALVGALLLSAVSCAAIDGVSAAAASIFMITLCTFNFAWNLGQPIFLSAATGFDRGGRLVPQMVASQSCGLAIGPFLGAVIGGDNPGSALIWTVTILFAAAAGLIIPPFVEASSLQRMIAMKSGF